LRRLGEEEQHDLRKRRDAVEVDAIEHVAALAPRADEPGAGEQAQMSREAGLADVLLGALSGSARGADTPTRPDEATARVK
jgi:hypothetical protein